MIYDPPETPAPHKDDCPGENSLPGLYVHVPFCISKCAYCGFHSGTDLSQVPAYLAALRREMDLYRGWAESFDTLYIGGGTPSVLTAGELGRLIAALRRAFTIAAGAEITVETNPADITPGLLAGLRRAGVNRLNIGVQSFSDDTLAFLGRRHTALQAVAAFRLARDTGFANIGLDLIYGLPSSPKRGETFPGPKGVNPRPSPAVETAPPAAGESFPLPGRVKPRSSTAGGTASPEAEADISAWFAALDTAIALNPDHLSCYRLTPEEGTPLGERCRRGEIVLPGESLQADFFLKTAEFLEERGYVHYEVSNFARPGGQSRHNRKYWNHAPYLGLGPAAHSFRGRERRWNRPSLPAYLKDLAAGRPPVEASELLTDEQLRLEALFLGLRTKRGIDLDDFRRRYHYDLLAEKGKIITSLAEQGLVEIRDGFLRPTRPGMAVADSLALI